MSPVEDESSEDEQKVEHEKKFSHEDLLDNRFILTETKQKDFTKII